MDESWVKNFSGQDAAKIASPEDIEKLIGLAEEIRQGIANSVFRIQVSIILIPLVIFAGFFAPQVFNENVGREAFAVFLVSLALTGFIVGNIAFRYKIIRRERDILDRLIVMISDLKGQIKDDASPVFNAMIDIRMARLSFGEK